MRTKFVSKECSFVACAPGNSVGAQHDCVAPIFCPLMRALYRQVVAYGQEHKRATAIMPVEKSCTMTYFQLHSGSEGRALYIHARNGDFIKAIYII